MRIPTFQTDERGLIPVVLQHVDTGEVLTLAYANAEAVRRTCESGQTWLFSRSRQELWHKGATSGNTQDVLSVRADCDNDALIYLVKPAGPACHTGARSCFPGAAPTLLGLEDLLRERQLDSPEGSYTAKLLADRNLRLKKLGEESTELALACADGARDEVIYEAADLLYHSLVAIRARGVDVGEVLAELRRRAGPSV